MITEIEKQDVKIGKMEMLIELQKSYNHFKEFFKLDLNDHELVGTSYNAWVEAFIKEQSKLLGMGK